MVIIKKLYYDARPTKYQDSYLIPCDEVYISVKENNKSSSWHQEKSRWRNPWAVQLIEVSSLQNREYFHRHHRDNDNAWSFSCATLSSYLCNLLLLISGKVYRHQSVKQSRVTDKPNQLYIRQKEWPNSRFERLQLPTQRSLVSIHYSELCLTFWHPSFTFKF